MKKIILAFAIIIGFSFVVFADDSFSWIDPDPVLGKQSQQNLKKQPVKKVLKKKRVLRKKKVSSEKPLQVSPEARKTSKKKLVAPASWFRIVYLRSGPPEPAITVVVKTVLVSQYVILSGMLNYNKPVIQSDVLITHKSGLYLDVWNSSQVKNRSAAPMYDDNGNYIGKELASEANPGNEIDYTLGWGGDIGKGFSFDGGIAYCDLLKLGKPGASEDGIYNYVKVSREVIAGYSVQVMMERFSVIKGSLYSNGNLYSLGLTRSDVSGDISIDSSLEVTHDTGVYSAKNGEVLRGRLGLTMKVMEKLNVVFQLNYYSPLMVRDGFSSKIVSSSGLTYQF